MKWLLAVMMVGLAAPARAEGPALPLPQIERDEQIDNARVQRASGAVLMAVGVALAVGSHVLAAVSFSHGGLAVDCGGDSQCNSDAKLFMGSIGMAASASALLTIGIPLYVSGNDKLHDLAGRARLSGFFGKNGGGGSLQIQF